MKKNADTNTEQKPVPETVAETVNTENNTENLEPVCMDEEKFGGTDEKPFLLGRIAELEKLNSELNDQYLRKAADFDNYRKRMLKEKQDAIDFANTNLLVDLIQILDNFDRAILSGGVQEAGTSSAALADGVLMIRNQLGSILENKYSLAYYASKGCLFDPNIHEAIGTMPSTEIKEPTVMEELVKGYKLKDRVIRVAKVMVSNYVEA